ncbi:FAD-dependent oxidoreductase [Terriglobus tenax]|uniref:FAD-dependent oxidoreductase n=1 Tax=Terriglobus tenax TaxID=1111115 RepID=UPI0021E0EF56|nr:FAD-dependent oxidoreductase [Terriglobus tenax]
MLRKLRSLALLSFIGSSFLPAQVKSTSADLVVYGATASGVVTAYTAAKQGMKVVLLEPGTHVGGMVTGGLSATDVAYFPIIGGYARKFYVEAAEHYGVHTLSHHDDWLSEPHVGEEIFNRWLKESGVQVQFGTRLKERSGVQKKGTHVVSITTEDGKVWSGKIFADCTYEGDLMAQAGVKYIVGREGMEVYNENLAGVREDTPMHQFRWKISAYNDKGKLMPEVESVPMEPNGKGDKKVQAYNFRLILTDNPALKLPWPKPADYDASRFELLLKYVQQWKEHIGKEPTFRDVVNPVFIPNHKADFNNNGAFSTDYLGKSWTYPDASYAERKKIWDDHMLYTQSFFYFLSTDPRVPRPLQDSVNHWGLAKDEFTDTGNWPNQLYVREGRRMVGQYVMHQADLQTERTKPDSIGMGSYNSDSHNVQRVALKDGSARNEGDMQVPVKPYEIAFGTMIPKDDQTDNLLVPVCFSASHVAYSSVRMEPQYMMIGQAAGDTAWLSLKSGVPVSKVSVPELQKTLHAQGAILHLSERSKEGPEPPK